MIFDLRGLVDVLQTDNFVCSYIRITDSFAHSHESPGQVFSIGTVAVQPFSQIQCFSSIQNTGTVPILKSFHYIERLTSIINNNSYSSVFNLRLNIVGVSDGLNSQAVSGSEFLQSTGPENDGKCMDGLCKLLLYRSILVGLHSQCVGCVVTITWYFCCLQF